MDTIELPLELRKAIEEADKKQREGDRLWCLSNIALFSYQQQAARFIAKEDTAPQAKNDKHIEADAACTSVFAARHIHPLCGSLPFFRMQCASGKRLTTAI
jgi:hypothetical protein